MARETRRNERIQDLLKGHMTQLGQGDVRKELGEASEKGIARRGHVTFPCLQHIAYTLEALKSAT